MSTNMKPCIPDDLPLQNLEWQRLLPLTGRANAALARYDGMLQTLPNPAVLLAPITANEAVLSSRIEGTQATLDEVLEHEAGVETPAERQHDIAEVNNYRAAVRIAERMLQDRPLSLQFIRTLHQRLLQGVRGRDKTPGAFRTDQNWIGRAGDPIEKARFIPPDPGILGGCLDQWESFLQLEEQDPVLQTAVAHAQFEILHPFKDGNGRIGRMIIPLLLYRRGALGRPMFYMSEYLEENRQEYYDRLLEITNNGDWQQWVEFFARALIDQAELNLEKVRSIRDLYDEMRQKFADTTHSQFAMSAVDAFFKFPVIAGNTFFKEGGFNNRVTASQMLRQLENAGLIVKMRDGSGPRPAIYAMPRLLNIAEGRKVME